ncbi:MAG: hypothetical protein JNK82_02165 [Myxococcaceae bacterium]|nr:hypothetical protein [Myxococcaceae bacterium]
MRVLSGASGIALLLAAASPSCKSESGQAPEGAPRPALTAADREGTTLKPNDKVTASLGPRKRQAARVIETYGKFALVSFDDDGNDWVTGNFKGWVLQKELTPQGAISNHPLDDTCTFAVNDAVHGHWNTVMAMTDGVVKDTYGKLAHVEFVNNTSGWTQCKLLKPRADEEDEAGADPAGGSSQVDAATKCKRGCNSRCHGAKNKSKCVGECRRACG